MKYDVFVDESCHLEHDGISVMCIGYIKVPVRIYEELKKKYSIIKQQHRLKSEIKWSKFSVARLPFYKALADFFFDTPLEFRCGLLKHKEMLKHEDFNRGVHDNFYYKMTYTLLQPNPPGLEYRVFMDIKDTRGREKLKKIDELFQNYHQGDSPFVKFQHLRSHDNDFFQITDLFIGAITYKCRLIKGEVPVNEGKLEFIKYLEEKSGFVLNEATPSSYNKFNIFDHQPKNQL